MSDSIESVYSQLACSSIVFNSLSLKNLKAANTTPIKSLPSSNKIVFTVNLTKDIEYVGVKA